ncbi:hypothetical protein KIW84_065010 [Lathyrus oleraceus]|uniref:Reverse transcriptase zinc-binding domain-containing protein n=1 Tax=Pisum sativum TaxID=3888 RepID=A0A9D5ABU7_PEA|nr:hypothetical protein KIW84_065010 [Pisum sativum]
MKLLFPYVFEVAQVTRLKVDASCPWINGMWDSNFGFIAGLSIVIAGSAWEELGHILISVNIGLISSHLEEDKINAFKLLWNANDPNNIQVFAWRLLMNMLQTRDKLVKHDVLTRQHNLMCPLCLGPEEAHLQRFLLCHVAAIVWQGIQSWIGLSILFHWDLLAGNLLGSRK